MKKFILTVYLGIRGICLAPFLIFRKIFSPRDEEIASILFLRHDRIGDMVASTPVFRAFKARFPSARVIVLASEKNAPVVAHNPSVDEVIVFKGWAQVKELKQRRFSMVVDLFYTYALKTAFLAWLIQGRYRLGFSAAGREIFFNVNAPAARSMGVMAERLLELGKSLGVSSGDARPQMELSPAEVFWAREHLSAKKIDLGHLKIALHPGAFFESQRWPLEYFVSLSGILQERFLAQVLVFCDQSGPDIKNAFTANAGARVRVFSLLTLREMAALLNECRLLVCNNSGPLHVAAALGIPTVSMLGPTDGALWSPVGDAHIVLKRDLPCLGCGKARCGDPQCLKNISVDDVVAAVEIQLKKVKNAAS